VNFIGKATYVGSAIHIDVITAKVAGNLAIPISLPAGPRRRNPEDGRGFAET
jgi:hypothetical protein